jgi:hypothetical protein
MLTIQNSPVGKSTKILTQAAIIGTIAAIGAAAYFNPASILGYSTSLGLSLTKSLIVIDALPWIAATSLGVYIHSNTTRNGSMFSTLLSSLIATAGISTLFLAARTISPGQQQEIEELHTNYQENATAEMLQSNMPNITNHLPGMITSALLGAVYMVGNGLINLANRFLGRDQRRLQLERDTTRLLEERNAALERVRALESTTNELQQRLTDLSPPTPANSNLSEGTVAGRVAGRRRSSIATGASR